MSSYQYRKSHCGDKTVVRSSSLHNGISYTGKTVSLYWIGALFILHGQYHCCWWPRDKRSQCINSHGTDLVILEYSGFSAKRIEITLSSIIFYSLRWHHMNVMLSQITSHSTVCLIAYTDPHQNLHYWSLARGIHCWPVNSPHKVSVTWKKLPFDEVTMWYVQCYSWLC